MSELKVIKSYIATFDDNHNEMLLVSHTKENYASAKQIECYLKSEADRVIAELKADYKEACDRLQNANLIKDEQLAATRHNKYKRCMAMAKWCEAELFAYPPFGTESPKEKWWQKWHNRWLELADKFKEAK